MRARAVTLAAVLFICSCAHRSGNEAIAANAVKNFDFEGGGSPLPTDWVFEKKAKDKGAAVVDASNFHSASHSLRLNPNQNNKGLGIVGAPLGMGQAFGPGKYRGKKVYLSGWLGAENGATAVIGVYALKLTGGVSFVELKQTASRDLKYHEDVLQVPGDLSILFIIVNCHVEGQTGSAWFDDVNLSLDPPPSAAPLETEAKASMRVDLARPLHTVSPGIYGANIEWIWDANGLWDSAHNRLDQRLVELARGMGVTKIRFPGGVFADFYHWRDSVGPRGQRKETQSMPGGTKSVHNFGIDEALELSRQLQAPLMITVNIVTGTPAEAVDLLRYLNQKTAELHAPKVVDYELGNEQYVNDRSPHAKAATMTPAAYVDRFRAFASELRKADAGIRLGAIADENFSSIVPHAYPTWSETVLERLGGEADFISVHNGYAPAIIDARGHDVREVYAAMLAAPLQIEQSLANTADRLKRFGKSGKLRIAVTEWGPFFHLAPDSPYVDHVKTMGSALYVAAVLKALAASPDVSDADFFKLNDKLFMGWIGERNGEWTPKAPYYAFQLFRKHFGTRVVTSSVQSPAYASHTVGWVSGMPQVPYVDAVASLTENGKSLRIIAINKDMNRDLPFRIDLSGGRAGRMASLFTLTGTSVDANTGTELFKAPGIKWAKQVEDTQRPRFSQGSPSEIRVDSKQIPSEDGGLSVTLPKFSIVAIEVPLS